MAMKKKQRKTLLSLYMQSTDMLTLRVTYTSKKRDSSGQLTTTSCVATTNAPEWLFSIRRSGDKTSRSTPFVEIEVNSKVKLGSALMSKITVNTTEVLRSIGLIENVSPFRCISDLPKRITRGHGVRMRFSIADNIGDEQLTEMAFELRDHLNCGSVIEM